MYFFIINNHLNFKNNN